MLRSATRSIAPPVVFGVLFLLAWQMLVQLADIPAFVLPSPGAIWTAFGNDAPADPDRRPQHRARTR